MPAPDSSVAATVATVANALSRELPRLAPGSDDGLLPVNFLLTELEEFAAANPLPPTLAAALAAPRRWIDATFDAGGHFDDATISRVKSWVAWLKTSARSLAENSELDPFAAPENATPDTPAPSAVAPTPASSAAPPNDSPDGLLVLDSALDPALLREFLKECQEHLQQIELGVLALEKDPADATTLNSIFRAFHSFKGGSGFLRLTPLNRLAHELESLLDLARQSRLTITRDVIDVILAGGDTLRRFVTPLEQSLQTLPLRGEILIPIAPLIARIRATVANANSRAPNTAQPAPENPQPETRSASSAAAIQFLIKVEAPKLDNVVDLVGELIISQSLLAQEVNLDAWDSQPFARHIIQLGRVTHELQKAALSLRMVSIRGTFWKMKRLVRDLAQKSGKAIELATVGDETELDRNLVEEIADPLVHMIRNAADHGIEPPEKRLAAGKPRHGTITLRAFHQGGSVVIEVRDDGAGLNRDRILAKAIERNLTRPGADLSESEIFSFIFAPGFSTADAVTDISGRGVGMDVVRRNLEKLRGRIDIQSQPGRGTTFIIKLPLTLAVVDGLIFTVGGQLFILPTLAFRESFRFEPERVSRINGFGEMIQCRGRLLPLVRLAAHFEIPTPPPSNPDRAIVIVVEAGERACAFLIDQLVRRQEVVIKTLGELFRPNPAVCGAAILGDGRVGLILDVTHLVTQSSAQPGTSPTEATACAA